MRPKKTRKVLLLQFKFNSFHHGLLKLVVVPVVYLLMENIQFKVQGWFVKKNVPVTDYEIIATLSIK